MKKHYLFGLLMAFLVPLGASAQSTPDTTINMATSGTDTARVCNATIYDNGGASGSYSSSCNSTLVLLPATDGQWLQISGTSNTETQWDYLTIYAGIGTSSEVLFCDNISGVYTTPIPTLQGAAFTLVFHSDASVTYAGFEINTTCIDAPSCWPVTDLAAVVNGSDAITLTWTDAVNSSASYTLLIDNGSGTPTSVSNATSPYIATGLNPNTLYTFSIISDCGGGDESLPAITSARTDCGSMSIPYHEGFDGYATSAAPSCWIPISGNVYVRSGNNARGGSGQYLDFRGTTTGNAIAMPRSSTPTGNLQVRFWTRPENFTNSSCGTFSVGYQTNLADATTFVELANWAYNTFSAYDEKEVPMIGAPDTAYIVLRHNANSTAYYWYVDDLVVEPIPSCLRPTNIAVDSVDVFSAHFSWVSGDAGTTAYDLFYNTENDITTALVETVTDGSDTVVFELTGLNHSTTYHYWVRAACSSDSARLIYGGTFTTIPYCNRPGTITLDSVGPYSAWFSWPRGGQYATDYIVYYGTDDDRSLATQIVVTDASDTIHYEISGLSANTSYRFWVQTLCGSDDSSSVRSYGRFYTSVTCASLNGVQMGFISYTAAQVTWSYNTSTGFPSTGVEITLTNLTDTTMAPIVVTTNATSYTFTGLAAGNDYRVRLSNYCETAFGTDTASANTATFATLGCNEVASTGSVSSIAPFHSNWNYSYTQSIYTRDDIATSIDTIRGISWSTASSNTKHIEVYMGYTSLSALGTSSFVPADSLTLMADTNISYSNGWNTINFNTPFVYNRARGNMVIAVRNVTGTYNGANDWAQHATDGNRTVYWYQDDATISMTNPSADNNGTLPSVPAVRFVANCDAPECFAPVVSLADADSTSITVTWESFGIESSWAAGIKADTATDYTYVTVSDTFYTFNGLDANTRYNILIGSLCGDDTLNAALNVRSGCGFISAPYTEGFEDYATGEVPGCWQSVMSGTSSAGTFPAAYRYASNARNSSVYFELESSSGQTEIVALPLMNNIATHSLTFWASVTNRNYTFEVGVMEGGVFVPVDTVDLIPGSSFSSSNYREYTVYFTNYTGTGNRMAMRASSTGSYTIMIDDVSINSFDGCFPVASINVAATDSNAITLSWTDNTNSSPTYYVNYWSATDTASAPLSTADTSITVTGLSANTAYTFEVVADCGTASPSTPMTITARTGCGSLSIPYVEDFESHNTSAAPSCWIPVNGNVYVRSGSNARGGSGQYLDFRGTNRNVIALPRASVPTGDLQVRFWTRPESFSNVNCGNLSVGYMTDLATDSTFVELANWAYNTFSAYDEKEVPMVGAPDSAYIVFRQINTNGSWYWYVDDLTVEPIPDCPRPNRLVATSATDSDINVAFGGSVSGNYILYISDGTTTDSVSIAGDSVYTFTGLTAATNYTISVAADCGSESSSAPHLSISTSTTAVPIALPYSTDFEPGSDVAWQLVNGTNGWAVGSAVNNGGTQALYISNDGGTSHSYTISSATSSSYAVKPLLFDTVGDYIVSYDWINAGESGWDFLRVFLAPGSESFEANNTSGITSSSIPTGWIALDGGSQRVSSSTWQNVNQVVSIANTGVYNLVFYWRNDGSGGTQPPAAVDNLQVMRLTCPAPQQLVLDAATTSSISFSWTPTGSESQWEVLVGGVPTVVSSPSYTATGLPSSQSINIVVRAICGAGDTSLTLTGTFATECDVINSFPYTESFEQPTAPAPCWTLVYGDSVGTANPMIHCASFSIYDDITSAYDGNRAFRFSSYDRGIDYNQFLISPQLSGSNLVLSFWYGMSYYDGDDDIRVGYSTTGNAIDDFTWGSWLGSVSDWTQFVDTMPDDVKYFAIHYYGDYQYHVYIDDLSITGLGASCDAPAITGVAKADDALTVTFNGFADNYEVGIVEGNTWNVPTALTQITSTTHTFSGLTPSTVYTIGVRALCAEGVTSTWTTITDTTADHPCFVPTGVTVSNITFDGATIAWTPGENETTWEINVTGPSYDQTFTTTTNPYAVSGLASNELFTVRVRAICSATQQSDWSQPAQFTTERCQPVTGVTATATTFETATVSWNPASNGSGNYEVEYGLSGFRQGDGTRVTVTGATNYAISGLDEETSYDVYVRSICTAGLTSEWSAVSTFTTPQSDGIQPLTSDLQPNIYPNPASTSATLTGLEPGATVTIVDFHGRTHSEFKIQNSEFKVDVTTLASGTYFVRVTGERQTAVLKLIVK